MSAVSWKGRSSRRHSQGWSSWEPNLHNILFRCIRAICAVARVARVKQRFNAISMLTRPYTFLCPTEMFPFCSRCRALWAHNSIIRITTRGTKSEPISGSSEPHGYSCSFVMHGSHISSSSPLASLCLEDSHIVCSRQASCIAEMASYMRKFLVARTFLIIVPGIPIGSSFHVSFSSHALISNPWCRYDSIPKARSAN